MTDPVEHHVAALTAAIHGPARVKTRLVQEARDGLTDAAAALTSQGVPEDRAAHQAVRDFGTVDELRPAFQGELTLAQARRTASLVALTGALLIACWQLMNAVTPGELRIIELLAGHLGGVAATAAVLAAAALAMTGPLGRRLPTPDRLPQAVAWVATTASVALAVSALALAGVSAWTGNWIMVAVVGTLTLASHVKVGSSARACRTCARLSAT